MLHHVTIRVADRAASESFYRTVLETLGIPGLNDFSLSPADAANPVTRRLHVAFAAPSRVHVEEFWRAGTQAGYRDDGAPGERPQYSPDYYGGFLLDPDGNSVEAVHRRGMRTTAGIDHLWIRVADVAVAKEFYATVAPHAGLRLGADTAERVQFRGDDASFSLVPGAPTEHLHLAFAAADDGPADAFPATRDPDGNSVEVIR